MRIYQVEYIKKLKPYISIYKQIFKIAYKIDNRNFVLAYFLFNVSFLASIGNIVFFTKIIAILMSDSMSGIWFSIAVFFSCLAVEIVFYYLARLRIMGLDVLVQKTIHNYVILNHKEINLEKKELAQLANRGSRLSGHSVEDIFNILNYSLYTFLLAIVLVYLNYKIFIAFSAVILIFLPLLIKSKKNTNRISLKFFNSAISKFSKENNIQLSRDTPKVNSSAFVYFFKIFFNYRLVSERINFLMRFLQSVALMILLLMIVYEIEHGAFDAASGLIFIFVVKNLSGYVSHILSSFTNLIKYYQGLKGIERFIYDIR